MMRKAAHGVVIASVAIFSGVFCPPATVAAATVTEIIEQKVPDNVIVEITDDIALEMEEAPGHEPADDNEQKEEQAEEQAVVLSPILPKAPSYGSGDFHDAIDARWATNKVFPYNPNNVYKIYCKPGFITDLALKAGETITYVGAGDTVQWVIDTTVSGGAPHVYIKPIREGIRTNLIVNTTRHSYQLLLTSADWYIPMVNWNYWVEEQIAFIERQEQENRMRDQKAMVFEWKKNYRYTVKAQGKKPSWMPEKVHDDGAKTFIEFGDLSKEVPVLFILDGKQKKPANYRLQKNSFVVDGVFEKAVLLSGQNTVVITNKGSDKNE